MPELHALLMGADGYLRNRLPDGSSYPPLSGCVRDVARVEAFLCERLGLSVERILRLSASHVGGEEPPEPRDQWPTYENMVAAFRRVAETARPGDHVYIHYSGHGGRTRTRFPELKGPDGLDECLVPVDIGTPTARYLRDIELAYLLRLMVDKGLLVTIVLDSCHSGGATRGGGHVRVRGLGVVDTTSRPSESLVASDEALAGAWRALAGVAARGFALGSGWLPEPKGYVLLAACRPSEFAYEYAFDGREHQGALTYWLLDALRHIGPGFTYKLLHDRVVAAVHSQFERQTPQLYGEATRVVLGVEHVPALYAVNILLVDQAAGRVLLNTGQAQGVRRGAEFAVYPAGMADFSHREARVALVELTDVGATESWARIVERSGTAQLDPGAQAVPVDPGGVRLRREVRLVIDAGVSTTIDQQHALDVVRDAIARDGGGWVAVAEDGASADYQMSVTSDGLYEIRDPAGNPLPNVTPPIAVAEQDAAGQLVRRLMHLSRYHAVRQLDNYDALSPLSRGLTVELLRAQPGYESGDRPDPRPFEEPGGTPTLAIGDWVFLHIRNESPKVLNVVVLDLDPGWGISQVYPSRVDTDFRPLDPGQEEWLPLQADLPASYVEGTDILKVLATEGTASFRWLELPPLDQPLTREGLSRGRPRSGLEQLLADVAAEHPAARDLKPAAYPSREWIAAQVEVRISRA